MLTIRPFSEADDDINALTNLLHRAYAPLASRGLRFTATHQSSGVTLRRLNKGYPLVAEWGGKPAGTITVYGPDPESEVPEYRDESSFHFGQFGVDPIHQGLGIGRALHDAIVQHAMNSNARFMCLDTAAPAKDLIGLYQKWGYAIVNRISFSSVNYDSVIMRRDLRISQ
jgi:ribosomal protein S18 acetylase RimI-like enzyme